MTISWQLKLNCPHSNLLETSFSSVFSHTLLICWMNWLDLLSASVVGLNPFVNWLHTVAPTTFCIVFSVRSSVLYFSLALFCPRFLICLKLTTRAKVHNISTLNSFGENLAKTEQSSTLSDFTLFPQPYRWQVSYKEGRYFIGLFTVLGLSHQSLKTQRKFRNTSTKYIHHQLPKCKRRTCSKVLPWILNCCFSALDPNWYSWHWLVDI